VLDKLNETDLMYTILLKETYPSWLYSVNEGATTMWERWDSYARTIDPKTPASDMNSFNHYSYGAIGEWMYERVAGIKPIEAGYKLIQFKPAINGPLNSARASYQSPYGLIESAWEKNGVGVKYTITVPPNTIGEVVLPTTLKKLLINGKGIAHTKNVTEKKVEGAWVYLTVRPGHYTLTF
jgi:alpha-L-rhamnosidase